MRIVALVLITAVVSGAAGLVGAAAPADAAYRCAKVGVKFPTGHRATATVRVQGKRVRCRTARRLVRRLVSGRNLPGAWGGEARSYGYGMTNRRTGTFISGGIR